MSQENMGTHHHMFLQWMMCKQVAPGSEIKQMYVECCRQNNVGVDVNDVNRDLVRFVKTINSNIHEFGIDLKKGICESDGTNYYLLVNTVENETLAKFASDYSQPELDYFSKLVDKIIESEDGCISSTEALNVSDHVDLKGKISKTQAQELLQKLAVHKWFNVGSSVSLGVHTLVELDEYLKRIYTGNVSTCQPCKMIVVYGASCGHCFEKFHNHCLTRFMQGKDVMSCPSCKGNWSNHAAALATPGATNAARRKRTTK